MKNHMRNAHQLEDIDTLRSQIAYVEPDESVKNFMAMMQAMSEEKPWQCPEVLIANKCHVVSIQLISDSCDVCFPAIKFLKQNADPDRQPFYLVQPNLSYFHPLRLIP